MLFEDNKLYKPKEVLDITKIGSWTLDALIKSDSLHAIRISERIRRFKGSDLNKLFC